MIRLSERWVLKSDTHFHIQCLVAQAQYTLLAKSMLNRRLTYVFSFFIFIFFHANKSLTMF